MTNWPAIRYLDATSFTETAEDPAITAAKMEGGYVLSRPRFTRRPRRTFSFNYDLMSDADKSTLEAFWNTVYGSSNLFNWTHPISGEVIVVRFDPSMSHIKFNVIVGPARVWKTDTISLTEV